MYNNLEKSLKYLKDKYAEKEADEEAQKKREERWKEINDAPTYAPNDFFCSRHGDFKAVGGKVIEGSASDPIAYYVPVMSIPAKFYRDESFSRPCKAKRYITDRRFDPYFRLSEMLHKQRIDQWKDLLQPGDPLFAKYWGDPYKSYYAQKELEERRAFELKKNRI